MKSLTTIVTTLKHFLSFYLLLVGIVMLFIQSTDKITPELFLLLKSSGFILIYLSYNICPVIISLHEETYARVKIALYSISIIVFLLFTLEFITRYLIF